MPQIGWLEILIIVVVAILIIGPKDFPIVLKKIGNWIGTTKRYFSDIQQKVSKIDVILHGIETIGSAERSCDKDEMRELFYNISDGQYKDILYKEFTKERVDRELDEFLDRDFFPRYGGGIGVTRMIRAMEMSNLLEDK